MANQQNSQRRQNALTRLNSICSQIDKFESKSKDMEHTDIGEVWDLLLWIKLNAASCRTELAHCFLHER